MIDEQVEERSLPPFGSAADAAPVDPPASGDLELAAVTSHGWRVTDRRLPLHDPFRLLAFVEQHGDLFEVMQLGAGFEWHEFDSLLEAVAFVVVTSPVLTRQRRGEEQSWLV